MEMKNGGDFCERIRDQIGMNKSFYVNPRGNAGGLALWWKEDMEVQVINETTNIIDMRVCLKGESVPTYITWINADTYEKGPKLGRT